MTPGGQAGDVGALPTAERNAEANAFPTLHDVLLLRCCKISVLGFFSTCCRSDEIILMFSKQSNDQQREVSWTRSLHLVLLFYFLWWEPTVAAKQWECGRLQAWGPGVPFTLCPPFIFISVHPETWPYVTHPLCNVQCTKQHFSGAAVSQGDRVSSTVSP